MYEKTDSDLRFLFVYNHMMSVPDLTHCGLVTSYGDVINVGSLALGPMSQMLNLIPV